MEATPTMGKSPTLAAYEQMLIRILRSLPLEKATELVNFARFLEFQVSQQLIFIEPAEGTVKTELALQPDKVYYLYTPYDMYGVADSLAKELERTQAERANGLNLHMDASDECAVDLGRIQLLRRI